MEMLKMHKSYNDNNSNIAEINIKSNLVDFMGESIRESRLIVKDYKFSYSYKMKNIILKMMKPTNGNILHLQRNLLILTIKCFIKFPKY